MSVPNERDLADIPGCLACDLTSGRQELPGGRIYETSYWAVEHCIGPLGVGTLIAKPKRHCVHLADLTFEEAAELGPLLSETSGVVTKLVQPDQVYACLWSHAGWTAGHIHFVMQPAWDKQQADHTKPGPFLQTDMFANQEAPPADQVAAFADRARALFSQAVRAESEQDLKKEA